MGLLTLDAAIEVAALRALAWEKRCFLGGTGALLAPADTIIAAWNLLVTATDTLRELGENAELPTEDGWTMNCVQWARDHPGHPGRKMGPAF